MSKLAREKQVDKSLAVDTPYDLKYALLKKQEGTIKKIIGIIVIIVIAFFAFHFFSGGNLTE